MTVVRSKDQNWILHFVCGTIVIMVYMLFSGNMRLLK